MSEDRYIETPPKAGREQKITLESWTDVLKGLLEGLGDIGKELLRAASSNPLIGIFLVLTLSDVFEKAGIIQPGTGYLVKGLIVSAAGVELGAEVMGMLTDVLPFAPAKNPQPEIFKPSVTTMIYAEASDERALHAALAGLAKLPK